MSLCTRSRLPGSLSLVLAAALAGCAQETTMVTPMSIDGDGGADAGSSAMPPDLLMIDLAPFAHPKLPQLSAHAGIVLSHVNLVTVNFKDTIYSSAASQFGDFVFKSNWWPAVTAEYGIGAGTHVKTVNLADNSPKAITDGQLAQYLKDRIMDGTLPSPADYPQLLIMIYFPPHIMVSHGTETLCPQNGGGFAGYHNYTAVNGKRFAYAVIGDCDQGPDGVTVTASHELAEAATDPYLSSYNLDANMDDPWEVENGQENGDLCEYEPDSVHEGGFAFQKCYSNKAAAAGVDPCVPGAAPVYQNILVLPEGVPQLAAGTTFDFTLVGWTTGDAQPWQIRLESATNADFSLTEQQVVLRSKTIWNNSSVTLTITVPKDAGSGLLGGLIVRSTLNNHAWPIAYTVQ